MPGKLKSIGNRFLKIINAPITIWVLSVIFLSIGGTYFSTFQQCQRDFSQFKESYIKIAKEYYFRRQILATNLVEAKSIDDVKKAVSKKDGLYSEFAGKPLFEISELFERLKEQIEFTIFLSKTVDERMSLFQGSLDEYEGIVPLVDGQWRNIRIDDLPAVRQLGLDFAIFVEDWADLYIKPRITAQCGPLEIYRIGVGQRTLPMGSAISIGGITEFAEEHVKNSRPRQEDSVPKYPQSE